MDKIITRLTKVSSFLDDVNENQLASKIDKTASNVLKIVEAQYVGVQGYWMRNSRCWPNCYRIKRAKEKNLSAQEVWQSCHAEYLDSIKGDSETWDKYAEDESNTLVKFAEAGLGDKLKEILDIEKKAFNTILAKKVASGVPVGVAIDEAIKEGVSKYEDAIIAQADELVKLANELEESGYKLAAAELADVASEIIKEAGPWNWLKGKLGFETKAYKAIIDELNVLASTMQQKYQEAWQASMQGSQTQQDVNNKFRQWATQNASSVLKNMSMVANKIAQQISGANVDKNAKAIGQKAVQMLNAWGGQFAKAPSVQSMRQLQEGIRNTLAGVEQAAQAVAQQAPQQGAQQQGEQPQ